MDKETFESAIEALRLHEDILGKESVDLAIQVLVDQYEAQRESPKDPNQLKQATILFADICGFTTLTSQLGVEDMHLLVTGLWQLIDNIISGFGGRIDKYMGDGFLAVFGLQNSSEDAPIRAIHAALEIQRQLSRYESNLASWPIKLSQDINPIQMRIGGHIGEIYLGQDGAENTYTIFGDAVNKASFIESITPAGGVLVSSALADHIHGVFEVNKHSLTRTKIADNFVQTWLVTGERPLSQNILVRSGRNPDSNLIGRGDVLNWVKRGYYKTLANNNLNILTLFGEGGIGKTRVVKEFIDWLDLLPDSVALIIGQGSQHLQNQPFAMLKNSLSSLADITATNDTQLVAEKLTKLLDQLGGIDDENVRKGHLLAQLIGFNNLDNPFVQDVMNGNVEIQQIVADLIIETAQKSLKRHRGVIFIFDDVQWADAEFIHVAGNHLQHILNMPILILMVGRSSFVTRHDSWRKNWESLGVANEEKCLEPLLRNQSIELIRYLLPEEIQPPQNVLEYIAASASGNPYFIEEFVKVLVKMIQTEGTDTVWTMKDGSYNLPIPTTLTGVLQARIEQLSISTKRILFHAATVGYTFWDEVLVHLQQDGNTKKELSEITVILENLVQQGFILKAPSSKFAESNEYYFVHQALRDVVYNTILKKYKSTYHHIIAEWMASRRTELDLEDLGYVGDHYWIAGDIDNAIDSYISAAELCVASKNYRAAIRFYKKITENLPVSMEKDRFAYLETLGDLYERVGRYDKSISIFEEMVANLTQDELKAKIFIKLCTLNLAEGNYQAVLRYADLGSEAASNGTIRTELIRLNYYRGQSFRHLGNLLESEASAKRALLLCSDSLDLSRYKAEILGLLSTISVQLGRFDDAVSYINLFDKETVELDKNDLVKKEIAHSLLAIGRYHYQLGHYKDAKSFLNKSYAIFDKQNELHSAQYALISLCQVVCSEGDFPEALSIAKRVADIDYLNDGNRITGLLLLSLMHLHNGNFDKAQAMLEQKLNSAEAFEAEMNPSVFIFIAAAKIKSRNYFEAQIDAKQAIYLAGKQKNLIKELYGWILLGVASGKQKTTVVHQGEILSSLDCLRQALTLSEKLNHNEQEDISARALVLYIGGSYEIVMGDKQIGRTNIEQARRLFKVLWPNVENSKFIQALLPNPTEQPF